MDFTVAIGFYIVLLIVLLWVTWEMKLHLFSAATVSFLLAGIFLMILIPPSDLDKYTDDLVDGKCCNEKNSVAVGLVVGIYILTLILVVWYVLDKAMWDVNENYCDT